MTDALTPWYEIAFEREYLDIYAHRDEQDAERALTFLERERVLHAGDRVLDLCCGNGRHSLPLCRRGHRVHGFDLSRDLLRDYQGRADCRAPLVQGDMRHLSYRRAFDVVLSLFTSFGYFERDEENWSVLREVAGALRPGGLFVLDFLNAPRVRADLRPHSSRTLESGTEVRESRQIDSISRRVLKTVSLSRHGAPIRTWIESVRLFTRAEVEAALREAGFDGVRALGDFDGSPHTDQSPRLILVSRLGS